MKSCPFCSRPTPDEARDCRFCRRPLVRACPFCAEEIGVTLRVCPCCSSDVEPGRRPLHSWGPIGEDRHLVVWILLSILTCGVAAAVWLFLTGSELNQHGRIEKLNPALDILLILVTCGLWFIFLMYRYPRTYADIVEQEGGHLKSDLPVLCVIVGIFFPIASLAILQNALNAHWKLHQR